MKRDEGQSLIEIAIALPMLLLILLGIVDVGRVFHDTIALSNAAQAGAAYAATLATRNDAATLQRVCDTAGFAPLGETCPGLALVSATTGAGGADAVVEVTYDVELFYARILGALGASDTLRIRATATYPGLAP